GETLDLDLPIPQTVPEGMLYVPAGRFLFGSAADTQRRDFYDTTPLYPSWTPAYLIARTETTWSQYIAYLEALPVAEAGTRPPLAVSMFLHGGAVELSRQPSGWWQLSIQPSSERYQVLAGEKIQYVGRATRRDQDWLRMPVVAVSADDADAYAA